MFLMVNWPQLYLNRYVEKRNLDSVTTLLCSENQLSMKLNLQIEGINATRDKSELVRHYYR